MYFDALGQFLIYRGWRKVLIVHGPTKKDKVRTKILEQSLKKFGADISDLREFTLSHHPDDRDKNKPEFLTGAPPTMSLQSSTVLGILDAIFNLAPDERVPWSGMSGSHQSAGTAHSNGMVHHN